MKANSLGSLATAEEILPSIPFFIHTCRPIHAGRKAQKHFFPHHLPHSLKAMENMRERLNFSLAGNIQKRNLANVFKQSCPLYFNTLHKNYLMAFAGNERGSQTLLVHDKI